MKDVIVEVRDLCISYKNVRAVQNVSFTVETGKILAIIGSNGSGKTSTVECIEGLRKPDSGSISVFDKEPWTKRCEIYKKMGVSLQETEYPAQLKVEELCRMFASFYERPADWEALLGQMRLADKRKRYAGRLSGGEKQRLSILLALMGRPKLLVLDEITTGLDPEVRQSMWSSFEDIKKSGISIVMVSHYLDEVEALADDILFLERGKRQFFGTKEGFREYAMKRIPPKDRKEGATLEQLYLMISPKSEGIAVEGII